VTEESRRVPVPGDDLPDRTESVDQGRQGRWTEHGSARGTPAERRVEEERTATAATTAGPRTGRTDDRR